MIARRSTETITIVGAGPVGALLALHLARRGFDIDILERRPDMRVSQVEAGRSINLALSTRGLKALHAVGLEHDILSHAVPMRGRMMHAVSGELTYQPYGRDDSEYINSVSRGGLNQLLMTRAEQTGRVRIHFNQRVTGAEIRADGVDLAVVDDQTGVSRSLSVSRVIGTDGSASAIRATLLKRPGYAATQDLLDYGYKELTLPAAEGRGFQIEKHALHIWPRGSYMTIALPNEDGSFTCTLFLPHRSDDRSTASFASLQSPAAVTAFFEERFPDLGSRIPDLSQSFFTHPTGSMVTVKSGPWFVEDRVLLVGDAAHAIVPFFGQGMNAGFEDCTILDGLLGQGLEWGRAFADFYDVRKSNTDAIADMAIENFVEMRDRVSDPRFLLEKEVEKRLMREFPGEYISRYGLVTFSNTPYRVALTAGLIQSEILAEICKGVSRPEDVDLARAGELIRRKLVPFLSPQYVRN